MLTFHNLQVDLYQIGINKCACMYLNMCVRKKQFLNDAAQIADFDDANFIRLALMYLGYVPTDTSNDDPHAYCRQNISLGLIYFFIKLCHQTFSGKQQQKFCFMKYL